MNKPVRVQAGRAQVGSSVMAGSCWCIPASEAPGRRAGNPDPGWPGCHPCGPHGAHGLLLLRSLRCGSPWSRGFVDGHLGCRRLLLHCLPCLSYLHHDLEEKHFTAQTSISSACELNTEAFKNSSVLLTRCGPVDLSNVPRWRYGGHHKVEGYGDVHGCHWTGACSYHANLVMGLEIHIGRTSCGGDKYRLTWVYRTEGNPFSLTQRHTLTFLCNRI